VGSVLNVESTGGRAHGIVRDLHLPKRVEVLEIMKSICALGKEIMLVSGFDGNESYNSGSGTGSPTIIRLGLWEDQVSKIDEMSHLSHVTQGT